MTVRAPRILDASGGEIARLSPSKLSFETRLSPLSTAEMVLSAGEPAVPVRSLIELYDEGGSAGVYRVTAVQEEPARCLRRLWLEQGLCTLSDSMTPAIAFTGTAREAFSLLLSHQGVPLWQLGEVDVPEEYLVIFTCPGTNLLTAVMDLMALLPGELAIRCDQSALPWTLNVTALTDADACEGRMSRNLTGVTILTDSEGLCTRVYPYGAGQGSDRITLTPLTGQSYLDAADASWGPVSRSFTAETVFDVPTLLAVAEKYLARHCQPAVSITATGADLSAMTGEDADSFRIGRMCRIALPEEGLVLAGRVVAVTRPDVISRPFEVTVTLSNRLRDTADEIADMIREVTASRVIGGRVTELTTTSYFTGTATSAVEHYFRVGDMAAVLSCAVTLDPDSGVEIVRVTVDRTEVPRSVWQGGAFDALPYLSRDELGQVTRGRHTLAIFPDSGGVGSEVTVKGIAGA